MEARRRDGAARHDALLDAALRCFAERGVLATGIEDIRRAAGASPSSVYNLFGGIGELTVAVLIRTFERLFAHIAHRVVATKSARAAVLALVDGHLEWVHSNAGEARFMYEATALELASKGRALLIKRKGEMLEPVVQHLARFIEKGTLPRWSPLQFDVILLGPSHEACRRWLAGAPLEPKWMRETLPALAWHSISTDRRRRTRPYTRRSAS